MSLIENSVLQYENETASHLSNGSRKITKADELTLHVKQVVRQESPMPEAMKLEKQKAAKSLQVMLNDVIEEKGETNVKMSTIGANEIELEGLSKTSLHSFLIKAEELGKTITYTRTLKVEITD